MRTLAIDAWNQTALDEVSITCRSAATGAERNDATIKLAVFKSSAFEPGIIKREGNASRISREVSTTLRCQMGDNQTSVMSFAQNTRDEVRKVNGDGLIAGALAAHAGMKQTNYLMSLYESNETKGKNTMKAEVRRLTEKECTRLQGIPDEHPLIYGEDTPSSSVYSLQGNGWARNCSRRVFKKMHLVDAKYNGGIKPFNIGTVSSGQGTHELSVQDFGDHSVFCADIAPFPCEVLKTRFSIPNFGDVTRIDYDPELQVIHNRKKDGYELMSESQLGFKPVDAETIEIPLKYGEMDCISGGLPCCSVSVAGMRHGAAEGSGTRSALAYHLPRIGNACGARWLAYENVPGLLSSNGGTDFTWFLYRLQEAGYCMAWRILDAQYVRGDLHPRAVPQRRRRIWLVAYRGNDWRIPCEVLFEPMKALGTEPPRRNVGIGYLSKSRPHDDSIPARTELEEFEDFIRGSKPSILDTLSKRGVCEAAEFRRKELHEAELKGKSDVCDSLFGFGEDDLLGGQAEVHQGRGLKDKDLELNCPATADMATIPQVELFQWAKTISSDIGYFGHLFKTRDGDASVKNLSPKMLANIGNAGFLCNGMICTMKMPEWNAGLTEEELSAMPTELAELYDGDVCGLSDILEENPDPKYKLSWRACYGILKRASNRGKKLPIELGYALVERMVEQASSIKWIAMYGNDEVKKEGQISVRQIAKNAFEDYVEATCPWDDVTEAEPDKSNSESEPDSESDDDDGNEASDECIEGNADGDDGANG